MPRGKQAKTKNGEGKKYSRRDFVAGSGTVLAGGALAAYTPAATLAATKAATSSYVPSTGYPAQKTLEDLGMKHVACVLQAKNKLGTV